MEIELKKGTTLYYAQNLENCGVFEVIELKARTIEEDWFTGIDKKTKHVYLFSNKDINKSVFLDRKVALDIVKEKEKNCKKKFTDEKYYEEY